VYGPFPIDAFTKDDASQIVATMTVEGWPDVSPLMVVELAWDSGGKATFDVSGEQRDENGQLMPEVSFSFSIPRQGGDKRQVGGGSVTVTTFAALRTAITLAAV
jgi:hypothetical protein